MTSPRRPRRTVSSTTWQGLSAGARADLDASEHGSTFAARLADHLSALGVELAGDAAAGLRAIAVEHTREAFLRGTEREVALETALAAERAIRVRLELVLRERGLPVPTDPRPSEPP